MIRRWGCFIKKLEQNEVHDCENGGYLWPLELNQTAPKMIRQIFSLSLSVWTRSPLLSCPSCISHTFSPFFWFILLSLPIICPLYYCSFFLFVLPTSSFWYWSAQRQLQFFPLHSIIVSGLLPFHCYASPLSFWPVFLLSFSILAPSSLLATLFPHAFPPIFSQPICGVLQCYGQHANASDLILTKQLPHFTPSHRRTHAREEQLTHYTVVRCSQQLQGLIKNQFIKWKQRKQAERGIISSERHRLLNMHLHWRK